MSGLTQTYQQQALNNVFPNSASNDHIAWSVNGTSEFAGLPRLAIGATGWAAATAETPSKKAVNSDLVSDAATAAGTVSHWAIFSAGTGGTQKSDWHAATTPRALAIGDRLAVAAGEIYLTLD